METINTGRGKVHICQDKGEMGKASANEFITIINDAIFKNGRATVGISGGHSPPLLYEQLTAPENKGKVDYNKVHFFVSDERCVPHDSKESNWGNAQQLLFSKLHVPAINLHPTVEQDKYPSKSATEYETEILKFFNMQPGEIPTFDLIQLGMGPDGHTASLFPGSKALTEKKRLVVENFVDKFETYRITFTLPMLNQAANVMFLIEGEEKSHVLSEVFGSDGVQYPVQNIHPSSGTITWYIDTAAARDLKARA